MADSATADLLFGSDQANLNFAKVLGELRRSHLSIAHRLRSIARDAAFVAQVAAHYSGGGDDMASDNEKDGMDSSGGGIVDDDLTGGGNGLPLVANERCGRWYIAPSAGAVSAYFKSTDGHTGQWAVSTRRLNLHLLELAGTHGGCILVDSTRRGKRMPDALSKTVPLWCCAVNRVLWGDSDYGNAKSRGEEAEEEETNGRGDVPNKNKTHLPASASYTTLYTPPGVVSPSEHSQMLDRVPAAVESLRRVGVLDDAQLWRARLRHKPLRPVWVSPDRPLPDLRGRLSSEFNVIVCCTASFGEEDGLIKKDYTYIQGAADDTENWAHGLTWEVFWAHQAELLKTPEGDLPGLIASLVEEAASRGGEEAGGRGSPTKARPEGTPITPHLSAGAWTGPQPPTFGDKETCRIVLVRQQTEAATWQRSPTHMEVGLGKQDKLAGRSLRYALPQICSFVSAYLNEDSGKDTQDTTRREQNQKRVVVLCPTGKDLSIGVALAILCACFDESGNVPALAADGTSTAPTAFNKDAIRVRLGRIMTALPQANPSRTVLQSVNSYLMDLRG